MADIHGDLIFDEFEPMTAAPCHHDEHDLNLSSDRAQEIASVTALALDPEQTTPSKDGMLNPVTEAADSAALEPHTDPTSSGAALPDPRIHLRSLVPNYMHPRQPNLTRR